MASPKYQMKLLTGSETQVRLPKRRFKTFLSLSVGSLGGSDISGELYFFFSPETMSLQNVTQTLGRTPSSAQIAQTGLPTSIEPVMLPVSQTLFQSSPLDAMARSNARPSVGSTTGVSELYNEIMDSLLRGGYLIQYRLSEGPRLLYLLGRSRAGDRLLIKVDPGTELGRAHVPEIQMERRSTLRAAPQELRVGALQCLNYDICGAAFVCNGNLCLAERPPQLDAAIDEVDFSLRSPLGDEAALGKSAMAYPVVRLSELLSDPRGYEERVRVASEELALLGYQSLERSREEFLAQLEEVRGKILATATMTSDIRKDLDDQIEGLSEIYERIKDIHPSDLPDDQQAQYYLIMKSLADKKELRRRFINTLSNAYASVALLRGASSDIHSQVDPFLASYGRVGEEE